MIRVALKKYFTPIYATFLVFVTPLAIPFAIFYAYQGMIDKKVWILTIVMYCLSGLGITLGYHRLATHRAFATHGWLKRLLYIFGSLAMQGPVAAWASLHIQHHAHSDRKSDPHSPIRGFWYSHCGWLFFHYRPHFRRYGKWLLKDKDIKHVSQYYLYYSHLGLLMPFLIAGWQGFLFAGILRLFLSCHVTWGINSICHRWGKRTHHTNENSRNHFLMALLSFGEGWHNNHHRFMQSPYLGLKWYEIDLGKWVLQCLSKMGLVWDLKLQQV